jgi:tetratricopeptide (TPR) repeat protein
MKTNTMTDSQPVQKDNFAAIAYDLREQIQKESEQVLKAPSARYPPFKKKIEELFVRHAFKKSDDETLFAFKLLLKLHEVAVRARLLKAAELQAMQTLGFAEGWLGTTKHRTYALILNNLGNSYYKEGLYRQAESFYQQALKLIRNLPSSNYYQSFKGFFYSDYSVSLHNLIRLYANQRRYAQVALLMQEVSELEKKVWYAKSPEYANSLFYLKKLYYKQGWAKDFQLIIPAPAKNNVSLDQYIGNKTSQLVSKQNENFSWTPNCVQCTLKCSCETVIPDTVLTKIKHYLMQLQVLINTLWPVTCPIKKEFTGLLSNAVSARINVIGSPGSTIFNDSLITALRKITGNKQFSAYISSEVNKGNLCSATDSLIRNLTVRHETCSNTAKCGCETLLLKEDLAIIRWFLLKLNKDLFNYSPLMRTQKHLAPDALKLVEKAIEFPFCQEYQRQLIQLFKEMKTEHKVWFQGESLREFIARRVECGSLNKDTDKFIEKLINKAFGFGN